MSKHLLVVNGHPDPRPERFCSALCDAYARGAAAGGWDVRRLDAGMLNLVPVSDETAMCPPGVAAAVEQICKADRLAVAFPLWIDGPPGSLNELFERAARAQWSSAPADTNSATYEKPARVIVTMDMPAFIQRSRAGSDGAAKRAFSIPGLQMVEPLFVGSLQSLTAAQRNDWLEKVRLLGAQEE